MAAKRNKKEVGADFMPEDEVLEQKTPKEYLKSIGSNATIPDEDEIIESEIVDEDDEEILGEEIIQESPQRTILEEEKIREKAYELIESGKLKCVSETSFDNGTIQDYEYEGLKFVATKVFKNGRYEIENIQEIKPATDTDDEFIDEIDEDKIKKPKSPEEAQKRIKKLEAEILDYQSSFEEIQDIAELANHSGIDSLLERLKQGHYGSVEDERIKDAKTSLKNIESVLDVRRLLGAVALNAKSMESSIKSKEKEIEELKKSGFQQELPLEVCEASSEEPEFVEEKPMLVPVEDITEHVAKINAMLEDGRFEFAEDTLEGILEWVEEHDHITEEQIAAIENIEASVE